MEKVKKIIIFGIILSMICIIVISLILLYNIHKSRENQNEEKHSIENNHIVSMEINNEIENPSIENTVKENSTIEQNTLNSNVLNEEPALLEEVIITNQYSDSKKAKVENSLQTYLTYLKDNNIRALEAITNTNKNILNFTILPSTTIEIKEMYEVSNIAGSFYYAWLRSSIGEEAYLIINMDYTNYAFQIIASSKEEFDEVKNGQIAYQYQFYQKVTKNEYNKIIENEK